MSTSRPEKTTTKKKFNCNVALCHKKKSLHCRMYKMTKKSRKCIIHIFTWLNIYIRKYQSTDFRILRKVEVWFFTLQQKLWILNKNIYINKGNIWIAKHFHSMWRSVCLSVFNALMKFYSECFPFFMFLQSTNFIIMKIVLHFLTLVRGNSNYFSCFEVLYLYLLSKRNRRIQQKKIQFFRVKISTYILYPLTYLW